MSSIISDSTFEFLSDLGENNQRDWFQTNKPRYERAHQNVIAFADDLLAAMNQHDHIETPTGKKALYRIYRDVRFSKNKSPYKSHFAGGFRRATAALRGGYYFQLKPGATFVAGGFFGPNKDDLARIRQEIASDPDELREILAQPGIRDTFGALRGSQLKTAPKGYDRDHPGIELLRHKSFILQREFSDEEVLGDDFVELVNTTFMALRPWFDYMSDVLTTDANGISLLS